VDSPIVPAEMWMTLIKRDGHPDTYHGQDLFVAFNEDDAKKMAAKVSADIARHFHGFSATPVRVK
jgi:hypothetical protein